MARTVGDVALLLDSIRVGPTEAASELGARDFKNVRIAWSIDFGGLPFDRRIRASVDSQRAAFEMIGCCVEGTDADFTGADEIFKTLRSKAFVEKHAATVRNHRGRVKDTILWEIARGERLTAADVDAAERARIELRLRIARFMERFEFLVLPTTQVPPFDVNEPFVVSIEGVQMESYIDWMKSCYFISAIGYPAVSVPCGFTPEGLPVGLQIVGREGADWRVLELAHAYEQVRGEFRAPIL
jgi:amidase